MPGPDLTLQTERLTLRPLTLDDLDEMATLRAVNFLILSVEDAIIPRGSLGVFARANSPDPLLVNFSELEVYQLQ